MYEVFAKLLDEHGETAYQVHKATGVSQSVLSAWKNGNSTPRNPNLKKIADHFGVSVAYLKGETEDRGQKKEEPAALVGGELKNAVIFSRDGKMVKKTYSPEKWKTIVEMLDAIPEDDRPL